MVSQSVIPSKQHLGGAIPYVFTEQGVYTTTDYHCDEAVSKNLTN